MKFEKKMSTALEMNAIFEKSMSKNVGVGARPRKCFEKGFWIGILNGDFEWGFWMGILNEGFKILNGDFDLGIWTGTVNGDFN